MVLDANDLEDGAELTADLCIVGAGAAGLTLASELGASGLRVLLLESGGAGFEEETQALYEGQGDLGVGDIGLATCRARMLGGSTNWWGGWCRPLDADDFEARDWIPMSGWPIDREELEPFYRRAHRTLSLGSFDYDPERFSASLGRPLLDLNGALAANVLYQFSTPVVRFGPDALDALDAETVEVLLHANLMNIVLTESGDAVARLECGTLEGGRFTVAADRVVLAMGGIETPRALLASNTQEPDGVGNAHGLVGRCFMEHPHFLSGAALVVRDASDMALYLDLNTAQTPDALDEGLTRDVWVRAGLGMTATQRRAAQLMGFAATLTPLDLSDPGGTAGELAADTVGQLLRPGGAEGLSFYTLEIRCEQRPNPASQITLTDEADALGVPRVALDWRVTDEDVDSVRQVLERLAGALGRSGARLWMPQDSWGRYLPERFEGGCHHMGTARMSVRPEDGVVTPDGRVHGVDNLYIAGSAVFPTGGFANPTLTLVALCHRLADHLKEQAR